MILSPKDYEKLREAVRKESVYSAQGFIGENAFLEYGTGNLAPGGLDHIYNARISHFDQNGNFLFEETHIDLSKYWTSSSLTVPPNRDYLAIYSKNPVPYGYIVGYVKYPDWTGMGYDDYAGLWIGFELGGGERWGIAAWWLRKANGANKLYAHAGGGGLYAYASEQTANLPADYTTAKHGYWVKVNKHQVWYGIDDRIRTIVVAARGFTARQLYQNSKPYTIYIAPFYIPDHMNALIEVGDQRKNGIQVGSNIELGYEDIRWAPGDPQPPLALPLYVEASDNVFAGQSIDSGSLTSHPIPVYGYEGKTIYFMADTGGTVDIEVLMNSGNWRTYDSVSYTGNSLLVYSMAGEAVLARVVYTPASYPATVLEGEVALR